MTQPQDQARPTFGWVDLAMLGAVMAWGLNFVVAKRAFAEIPPYTFNGIRFIIASIFMLGLTWISERSLGIERRDWPRMILAGVIGNGVYQMLFIYGLDRTTAGNSSLLVATNPIFIALMTGLLGLERVTRRMWGGILISFMGMVIVIANGANQLSLGSSTLVGDGLTLLAGLCWALYAVIAKPLTHRYSSLKISALAMISGTPVLLIAGIPGMLAQDWSAISWAGWSGTIYSAVFSISLAYVAYTQAIHTLGNARTGIYSNLVPVVAMVTAAIGLGEPIRIWQAIGAIIILAGVYLTRSGNAQR